MERSVDPCVEVEKNQTNEMRRWFLLVFVLFSVGAEVEREREEIVDVLRLIWIERQHDHSGMKQSKYHLT